MLLGPTTGPVAIPTVGFPASASCTTAFYLSAQPTKRTPTDVWIVGLQVVNLLMILLVLYLVVIPMAIAW